jgi:hypothetical protein
VFAARHEQPQPPPGPKNIDLSGLAQQIAHAMGGWLMGFVYGLPETALDNSAVWARRAVIGLVTSNSSANVLIHNPLQWVVGPEAQQFHNAMLGAQVGLTLLILAIGGWRIVYGLTNEWEVLISTGTLVGVASTMHLWYPGVIGFINDRATEVATLPTSPLTGELPGGLELVVMLLFALWYAFWALLKGLVGVVFLAILYVVGPFVIMLGAVPFFAGLSQWWTSHVIAWMLRPFFVALVLRFGLGIGLQVSDVHLQLLAAIGAFWLADHLPDWLASDRLAAGAWSSIAQLALLSRVATALGGAAGTPLAGGVRALRAAF